MPSIIDNNIVSFSNESVNNFYHTSASTGGTPEHVGLLQPFIFFYFPHPQDHPIIHRPNKSQNQHVET
jgi:hypothetical protein